MKNTLKQISLGLCILVMAVLASKFLTPSAHSQQVSPATPIQQTATMLNAATKVASSNPGANAQATATMTPSGSNYVYITSIDLAVCQNATSGANTNLNFTSTNITGAPVWSESLAATANLCAPVHTMTFATPLKSSTPGTAVTIVSPTAQTNTAFTVDVTWYEAQ